MVSTKIIAMTSTQPQPAPSGPSAPPARQNGPALAGLIVGIVSFIVNPLLITSIVAVILGILGLRRAPLLGRRNLAVIGIALAVIGAIISIVVTSAIFGSIGRAAQTVSEASQPVAAAPSDDSVSTPTAVTPSEDATQTAEPSDEEQPSEEAVPAEYRSALAQAQNYSDNLYLSKDGLFDQLTSDYGGQFPKKAAQYAIDNVDADWNKNALAQAKNYQENLNLSRAGIHDQLTSDFGGQFTNKQADYALEHLDD